MIAALAAKRLRSLDLQYSIRQDKTHRQREALQALQQVAQLRHLSLAAVSDLHTALLRLNALKQDV